MERANIALLDSCKAPADLGVGMNMAGGGVPKDPKVLSTLQRLRMFQDV